jgi:glycosidase
MPGNQWDNVAVQPPDSEPYARHSTALSWLLGLPGAPLLYYGDEYGQWGGADPGNRAMWRGDGTLSPDEQAVLGRTKLLGTARKELLALRRGGYRSLHATETFLAFARETSDGKLAIVAVSRDPNPVNVSVTIPASLPLADGTTLVDRLGGPSVTASGGKLMIQLPPRGAAFLAP